MHVEEGEGGRGGVAELEWALLHDVANEALGGCGDEASFVRGTADDAPFPHDAVDAEQLGVGRIKQVRQSVKVRDVSCGDAADEDCDTRRRGQFGEEGGVQHKREREREWICQRAAKLEAELLLGGPLL